MKWSHFCSFAFVAVDFCLSASDLRAMELDGFGLFGVKN